MSPMYSIESPNVETR